MTMYNVVLSQIGKNKEQLFSFFVSEKYDTDKVHNFYAECEEMLAYAERELNDADLHATQSYNDGSWSYGSEELDNWIELQQQHIEDLQQLRDNAEDCYSMLDDYLAELQ